MARRKLNPEHPTRMNRIGHRPPSNIVRQKREVKERGNILTWDIQNFSGDKLRASLGISGPDRLGLTRIMICRLFLQFKLEQWFKKW